MNRSKNRRQDWNYVVFTNKWVHPHMLCIILLSLKLILITNPKELNSLVIPLSKNKEFQQFTNKINIKDYKVTGSYAGNSKKKYKVFMIALENDFETIISAYDPKRDLIIDIVKLDQHNSNNIVVESRNSGLMFEGSLSDAKTLQYGSYQEKEKVKEKFLKKHGHKLSQPQNDNISW